VQYSLPPGSLVAELPCCSQFSCLPAVVTEAQLVLHFGYLCLPTIIVGCFFAPWLLVLLAVVALSADCHCWLVLVRILILFLQLSLLWLPAAIVAAFAVGLHGGKFLY
jgi:hypothetical protein